MSWESQLPISTLRGLLSEPSQAHWRELCGLLSRLRLAPGEERWLCDYLEAHLDDWPDGLRAPPFAWWTRPDKAAFWPIIRGDWPFDELLFAELCDGICSEGPEFWTEDGLLLVRRSFVELRDAQGSFSPLLLDHELLRQARLERSDWLEGEDDGLRIRLPSGVDIELGFEESRLRDAALQHLQRSLHSPSPVPRERLPHPHFSEEEGKWTLGVSICRQEPQRRRKRWLSTTLREERVRYHEWSKLANQSWERLDASAQSCFEELLRVFSTHWGMLETEEVTDVQLCLPREGLTQALRQALSGLPEDGSFERTRRILEMLEASSRLCTQVLMTFHWGFG